MTVCIQINRVDKQPLLCQDVFDSPAGNLYNSEQLEVERQFINGLNRRWNWLLTIEIGREFLMLNFLKGSFLFLTGLAISLVIGWWLMERRRRLTSPLTSDLTTLAASEATAHHAMEAPPAIVLPPEAFEDLEELPSIPGHEPVSRMSDNGIEVKNSVLHEDNFEE